MPSDPVDSFARRVERLFQEALDLPEPERAGFVGAQAGVDLRLASSVEALLRASASEKSAWGRGAFAQEARQLADEQDAQLDRYRLEERIGAGGMGVVYRAFRADDEFAKCVAIKIVQWAAGESRLAERFRAERQILASLEHPNIARLLDGGTTKDGRPFLVMEYIDGLSLDQYLTANTLPAKAKLAMFRKICDGVSCAHRNLVVHRDLKPSNILVTAAGEPKLLDFGIAKLTDGQARTETGYGAMTPRYASPEQVANAPVATSSDIYSLGVVLYEMLTGVSPYAADSALQLTQAISTAAPVAMRGVDRDLETIVQMALRKEPARRYASVDQFSADVQRYLDGFPVMAQADTLPYRARKFVGRNKVPVAATVLVTVALVAGIVSTTREARIANQRFNDVRKLANAYLFEIHDAIGASGPTAARQLVARRAQEYLDTLSREKTNDPGLLKELAAAYEKLADVQGRREQGNIGDPRSAQANYRKALALREQLYSASPRDVSTAMELAHTLLLTGNDELAQRKLASAETYARRALVLAETPAELRPLRPEEDLTVRETLGVACQLLGDILGHPKFSSLGQTRLALQLFERSLDLFEKNLRAAPERREKGVFIGATLGRIGWARQALGDGPGAIDAFRKSFAAYQSLSATEPASPFYRFSAAVAARSLAVASAQVFEESAAAKPLMDQAVSTIEALARADPGDVGVQTGLADTYSSQGMVPGNQDPAARLRYFDRAVTQYEKIDKTHPGSLKPDARLTTLQLRTDALLDLGQYREALDSARGELEIDDVLLRLSPANAFAIRNRAVASGQIGRVYERQKKWSEARDWYQRASGILLAQRKQGILLAIGAALLEEIEKGAAHATAALR